MTTTSANLFPGFDPLDVRTTDVHFAGVTAGSGTPILLLHGYPETHSAWHRVAPALAAQYTVVVPDLPGYGNSALLSQRDWSKRDVAAELVAMMIDLRHDRFAVVGHDRGARVGYRLALDHPDHVLAYAALAAVPTLDVWPAVDREFARTNFHWFFFLQTDGVPETLLAADPDRFLDTTLTHMAGSLDTLHPAALADYRAAFRRPTVRAAMMKDYRAAYRIDDDHDRTDRTAGRTISCPVLSLWGNERVVAETTDPDTTLTALDVWKRWADNVTGAVVPAGHLIPEHAPTHVIDAVTTLVDHASSECGTVSP